MLGENAAYLAQNGELVYDYSSLFSFEVLQASGLNATSTLASATDAFRSTSGLSLDFSRVYNQGISSRYETGILGYGWNYSYDYYLEEVTEDNAIRFYNPTGGFRLYVDDGNGGYESDSDLDFSTLVKNNDNSYTLTESNGVVYQFNPNLSWQSFTQSNGSSLTATYSNNKLSKVTHSDGQYLEFTYNNQNRLSKITDDLGQESTYSYDSSGEQLTQVTDFNDQVLNYTYNNDRGLTRVSNEIGNEINYSYDSQQRLSRISLKDNAQAITYSYNNTGIVTITDENDRSSKLFYDDRGNLIKTEDELGQVIKFDNNDDRTITTLPDGTTSTITYNEQGYAEKITDGLGNEISLNFDPLTGNLQWLRDANNNPLQYTYDANNNLSAITYADNSVETFTNDDEGKLIEYVNRRGDKTGYDYNDDGLLISQENADGTSFSYTYDTLGNLRSSTDSQGTTTFDYNSKNQLTKITYPTGRFLEYSYDDAGNRTQIKGSDGYTINYAYDDVGRITSLKDGSDNLIVSYDYDNLRRLEREDKGNGTYTTYQYDEIDRLTGIIHYTADDTINSRFDYTYDRVGSIATMTTLDGEWTYDYDSNGQLINAVFDSTNNQIANQDITYVYDGAGNRIQTIINGQNNDYTSNNLNQYSSVGATVYDYDTDGNLISKTQGSDIWTYDYNFQNQLVKVVEPNNIVTEYEYDAFGDRIATIYDGVRTEYVIDPSGFGNVVAEYDSDGNLIANYSHGLGLETRFDGSDSAYYDFNQIGSTVGLTGSNGNSYLNSYSYLPFGGELSQTEAITNPFEFVGEYGVMEEANGLDFMRARYYDSNLGRFTSPNRLG